MSRQIQVPDDVYEALVRIAEASGHKISIGRGSGLVATLKEMCAMFAPLACEDMDEAWMRFNIRIAPAINELALEAMRHGERVNVSFSSAAGMRLERQPHN